jgi:acyl-CoA synthetase (AMP-forming)/AMP-acid ligase II/aryl carrier-like protein
MFCYLDTASLKGDGEKHVYSISADDVAFIQYTSGSTGESKKVVITHGQLMHNLFFQASAFNMTILSIEVVWIPHYHFMGLVSCLLLPLYVGYRAYLMSPSSFFGRPGLWLEVMSNVKATVARAPSSAFRLLQKNPPKADLTLLTAFYALETSEPSILADFVKMLRERNLFKGTIKVVYGLAEHTGIVTVETIPDLKNTERELLGHGFPSSDVVLKVVDPVTLRECGYRQMGEIWLDSPSKASRYWGQTKRTKKILQAKLEGDDERSYLRTGDLGFIENSQLFIAGPMSDVLTIKGRVVFPQQVEFTVREISSLIRPASVAVINVHPEDGQLALVVVAEVCEVGVCGDFETLCICEHIAQAVKLEHEAPPHAVCLIKPNTLPKTPLGRVQRAKVRDLYNNNRLDVVYHVPPRSTIVVPNATVKNILKVMEPVLTTVELEFDMDADILTQGMQSLDIMELQEVIKSELKVDIIFTEILELGTPLRIAEEIGRRFPLIGPEDAFKRKNYFSYPGISDLQRKTRDELKAVEAFCLGRKGFGLVVFPGVTDVSILDLKTFRMKRGSVRLPVDKRTGLATTMATVRVKWNTDCESLW